jgi:hypothetical protein
MRTVDAEGSRLQWLVMVAATNIIPNPYYRCAGPNCGLLKGSSDRWWLMWTSLGEHSLPVMHLAPWDEELAVREGALHVCGDGCAQKLQSQFMGNVRENQGRKASG